MSMIKQIKSKLKTFEGVNIREVWDFRLSQGNPVLYCNGPTWVIKIWSNAEGRLLKEHDTEILTKGNADDLTDYKSIGECYKWLYSVRDKYSIKDIDKIKPKVAVINAENRRLAVENKV